MQLRIVYSSFTHIENIRDGSVLGSSDASNQTLPESAVLHPLFAPSAVIAAVGESDSQLAAILNALGPFYTSSTTPYSFPFGILGTGVMPDGSQFIEVDVTAFIDRTFDEWQWFIDNDPGSSSLPAGFTAGWMSRRADVIAFKEVPTNNELKIQTWHSNYSNDWNITGVDWDEVGLYYIYGFPTLVDAWIYDLNSGALLATDANLTTSIEDNTAPGQPTQIDFYNYILTGGSAQKFWTNFRACIEDV